ncbi:MAG: TatD family hydrolase, partial [Prevotella sp.]|nr:TatD family hydrolase [Prevotella sp.]
MIIDTHIHLDGEEFEDDLELVVERARLAGVCRMLLPAIDVETTKKVALLAERLEGFAFPMIGLHPEEVKDDWQQQLDILRPMLGEPYIAIGEIGLDFYWSREYEQQQLEAFEQQVIWSVETQMPLMIH